MADITCGPDLDCEHQPRCIGHEADAPVDEGWEARMSARAGDRARRELALQPDPGVVQYDPRDLIWGATDMRRFSVLLSVPLPEDGAAQWALTPNDERPYAWEFEAKRQPAVDPALGPDTLILDEATTSLLAQAASAAVDRARAGDAGVFEVSVRVHLEVRRL